MEKEKILMVIDVQNDFANGSLGSAQAVASIHGIVRRIGEYETKGRLICVTRDTHEEGYLETREGKYLPVEHCMIGTYGHELVPAVAEALEGYDDTNIMEFWKTSFADIDTVNKIREEAWRRTGKDPGKGKGLSFLLVGWCTDICVISNALVLKARFPEADIAVDADCCAGVTVSSHEAALAVMKSCQIDIIRKP